jgi:shikimate kinase
LAAEEKLHNTIIVLIGFAGTGKYTIGRIICDQIGAKLIDNHLINNSIFTVVDADGIRPLPTGVWEKVIRIREVVYSAIRELSPPEMSFVFTIQLVEEDPRDRNALETLATLAADRGSLFVPVRLICELEELCRRVSSPARARMLKQISPEVTRKTIATKTLLNSSHPNLRTIDVSRLSAAESAAAILKEVSAIRKNETGP